ncbi:Glyoxalase 3 [Ceratocystis fimbriata CBS 114723]|uniref:D-lactate dehydratase n=1 Tax=Ceratocystis fimbriata CBS 114723 TaxID=1035309 RepID=A0A2C5WXN6_9PEZI|nr:Glyoxalase 3 [Ceratocystis fimbriata CBS 114723]
MAPKVLIVLTSYSKIEAMDRETGWFLPELAHPYDELKGKAEMVFASPKGGVAPLDPGSIKAFESDPSSQDFLKNHQDLWENTQKLSTFVGRSSEFDAIFYPGGHGPMFDLATDPDSIALIAEFHNAGKPIAAVCHGPGVLVNVKGADGEYIVKGKPVTGFSNSEEDTVGYTPYMPFMLETAIQTVSGATYVKAEKDWDAKVVVSGNIITGQNPASAKPLGEALVKALGL